MRRAELYPPLFISGSVPRGFAGCQCCLPEMGLVEGEVPGILTTISMYSCCGKSLLPTAAFTIPRMRLPSPFPECGRKLLPQQKHLRDAEGSEDSRRNEI